MRDNGMLQTDFSLIGCLGGSFAAMTTFHNLLPVVFGFHGLSGLRPETGTIFLCASPDFGREHARLATIRFKIWLCITGTGSRD